MCNLLCVFHLIQQAEMQKFKSESEKMEMRLTDYKKLNESLKCDLAKVLKILFIIMKNK